MSERTDLCRRWYKCFDGRQLEALMALFGADPMVVVGAGASHRVVPYAGVYRGEREVRNYYTSRFEQEENNGKGSEKSIPSGRPIRPFCGMVLEPLEFGPWVVFRGDIEDHPNVSKYKGPFLHVFRFEEDQLKIASLEMFLAPQRQAAGGV